MSGGKVMYRGVEAGTVFLITQKEPFWWAVWYILNILLRFLFFRHNPKNNAFTSVFETPININAKKLSEVVSEVRSLRPKCI